VANINDVINLLNANHKIIYIVSYEEERVCEDLKSIFNKNDASYAAWTFSSGYYQSNCEITGALQNPVGCIDEIIKSDRTCAFILKDYHAYLSDAGVVRKIKDCITVKKEEYTPIVIITPIIKIPIELEKYVTIVEYDLPTAGEIKAHIEASLPILKEVETTFDLESMDIESIVGACQGMTFHEIDRVLMKSLSTTNAFTTSVIVEDKKQIIKKSGILEFYPSDDGIDSVGGLDSLKQWLSKRRMAFSENAKGFGIPTPKGIMLIGVPGCGKSLIAKAIAKTWQMPLLKFDVGAVMQGVVGASEENMRKVIKTANSVAPCVLWLDEIEKGFAGTASSNFSDSGTLARCFATFITWLNEKTEPVFVVATANDVSQLPPELMRKGRFDETFFVDLPSLAERKDIFKIHLRKLNRNASLFELDILAEKTEGFSGADIRELIVETLHNVFFEDAGTKDITTMSMIKSIETAVPLSKLMGAQVAKLKDWCKNNKVRLAS
jgi:ATP-dependent 26S proteasome regulatory subunit